MAACRAVDAREPVVRIAAFQKALDYPLFEQPLKAPAGAQFCRLPVRALIQRACTRLARPVRPTALRPVGIAAHKLPRRGVKASSPEMASRKGDLSGDWRYHVTSNAPEHILVERFCNGL